MSSLAIVEKKPPFAGGGGGGGGCAGGVLFHLLDWHRRLARKKRLFSPRCLLPSSLRSSPRKLLTAAPAPPPPPSPPPAASEATPGVVARLMGLESWPANVGAAAAPRPQKQRKVEASAQEGELAVLVVVPPPRRCPPAAAPRSHHGADLQARSPRRSRLVQAAAAKLLEPSARASSRASARLALAYASSSPHCRKDDGHSGALQSSGMSDDFLSRSGSLSLERSARAESVAVEPPVLLVDTARDNAALSSHWHKKHSNDAGVIGGSRVTRVVMPTTSNGNGKNPNKGWSDMDVMPKGHQERTVGMNNCVTTVDERLLRKRATPTRPKVVGGVGSRSLVSSIRQAGCARELVSASTRVAQNGSCPRQESIGLINAPGGAHRDMINRSGVSSTSKRMASNGSGPRREPRKKVGCGTAVSDRKDSNTVAFASSSFMRPIARTSSHRKLSEKSGCWNTRSDSARVRTSVVDAKCAEASSDVATSERDEFSRLLEAKIKELGLFDRNDLASSDALSGKLTASVLQELISALTNDMNTPTSRSGSYSDASAPLNDDGTVGCIDQSGYAVSNDQSPELHKYGTVGCVDRLCYALSNDQSTEVHKYYQGEQEVNSSAICVNSEGNQPSPTSILEACFSNDTSSLGSPTEKSECKDLFVSMENKMEDLFNLEIDIVDLATSIDAAKADATVFHDSGKTSCVHNFAEHDFKFLEARLHSIREAISNAELLLGSSPLHTANEASSHALHSVIIEILETIVDVFRGSEQSLGITEEKQKCQLTNFLFDCIVESLNSKFCNFGKCGYKAWLRLPLTLSKDMLKREVYEEISCWGEMRGTAPNRFAEEELNRVTAKWDGCQVEAFGISIAIEKDILDVLVDEFTLAYR